MFLKVNGFRAEDGVKMRWKGRQSAVTTGGPGWCGHEGETTILHILHPDFARWKPMLGTVQLNPFVAKREVSLFSQSFITPPG